MSDDTTQKWEAMEVELDLSDLDELAASSCIIAR